MEQELGLVVADASVVLKWQLDDEDCIPQATALRDDFYWVNDNSPEGRQAKLEL